MFSAEQSSACWMTHIVVALLFCLGIATLPLPAHAAGPDGFDFVHFEGTLGWTATHDIARLQHTSEGLRIDISGSDPYMVGPARDFAAGQPIWVTLRIKSESGGDGQLFYFTDGPNEKASLHFDCRRGMWEEVRLPLPPLGPGFRFRIDPPGDSGSCIIAAIGFQPRKIYTEPDWLPPDPPIPANNGLCIQTGDLRLEVSTPQWNDFTLYVDGHSMAIGHTRPLIGVIDHDEPRWIPIGPEVRAGKTVREGRTIVSAVTLGEPDGTKWNVRQTFSATAVPGVIQVRTEVTVDRDRNVLYLPMLIMLPGSGSFGANKDHALFAGLEYLDANEPSSSEADIIGPGSHRQVPDSMKSTLPLMAIAKDGRYVGLAWQPDPAFCALFDSPDRHLHSNGHAMGILYPGSDGSNRVEGSFLPYEPKLLRAGRTLTLYAALLGGKGASIVPAVQQYVALHGLLPVPKSGVNLQKYVDLAVSGWLDSDLGDHGQFKHALPGEFKLQPAADVAAYLDWLAGRTENEEQATRLRSVSREALTHVGPTDLNFATVGHVRYPLPALLYGNADLNAEHARQLGHVLLQRFDADGSIPFRRSGLKPDFGRTHFAPDANGLTAEVVANLLECAAVSGEPDLIREGLRHLSGLDRFADNAPRGAQTWEVPLHTPDILASAYLVRAYVLGYALTGESRLLDMARYWAWTGIPFVYLTPPVTEPAQTESGGIAQSPVKGAKTDPIGLYATTPVYGATEWIAPNWMGRPVQWCGLVYADSLYRLAKYDANPTWKAVADGITESGIQQSWPRGSNTLRQGLLPDSVSLRAQGRNDAAINPGTLEACAVQYFTGAPLYDMQCFRSAGVVTLHAPGRIKGAIDEASRIVFTVEGWPSHEYDILIAGLKRPPQATIGDKPVSLDAPNHFSAESGRLVLRVSGKPKVEIRY